jgi:quinoprotein glucose dehydrogenase
MSRTSRCPARIAFAITLTAAAGAANPAAEAQAGAEGQAGRHRGWEVYNGGPEAMKYSALDQVNRDNVRRLAVAWTYNSGDQRAPGQTGGGFTGLQINPLIVGDTLYGLSQQSKVFALDAATGKPRWVHRSSAQGTATRRGLAYWQSPDGRDRRLFFTVGPSLMALDAATGTPIAAFGRQGVVTLYVDRDSPRTAGAPSPGIVFEDLLIMGSVVGEMYGGAPGNIRAYDVRSGELRWVFRTVPHPGEYGHETWAPDSWKRNGGANVWGAFSLDLERALVFAPTGSPSYDFYGADRPGQNLFGNCVLALDARTGKRRWHFQTVHHDLWDYDLSAQPTLATIRRHGKPVDAVIQVTKHGFVFVLDRLTGKPLFPVQERPVPRSDVPGERAWPTQPAPVARQRMRLSDLTEFPDPAERRALREKLLSARNQGIFTPPSIQGTISVPGHNGGPLWGGGAFDPQTGMFYVTSHDQPSYFKLSPMAARPAEGASPLARGRHLYRTSCAACHGPTGSGVVEIMRPLMLPPDGGVARPDAPPEIPDLGALGAKLDRVAFGTVVRLGKGRMPPAPLMTDAELDLLADYVRRIREPAAQEAQAAAVPAPGPNDPATERRYSTPWTFFRDSAELPAIKPPWGRLTAIDMNSGRTVWVKLVGEEKALTARGIPQTGHKYLRGGPVVTAGGLIFLAGTQDRSLRAFDKRSGALLWTGTLPFDAVGMPAIYQAGGKQFVAVTAMGDRGHNPGDAVVAFALPD